MSKQSWRASGAARPPRTRSTAARPEGSLHVAVDRARVIWDGLTGGPTVRRECTCGLDRRHGMMHTADCPTVSGNLYTETAAAAILDAGLRLWPDTAAAMSGPEDDGEG